MPLGGPARPLAREPVERPHQAGGQADRVHTAALLPRRLVHLGVRGAALHAQRAVEEAAGRDPQVEARRLGHEPGVGAVAARDRGVRPHGARLLVGHRLDDHVALEPDARRPEHLEREDRRADAALHVDGAAAVDPPVADVRREGRRRPGRRVARAHDVDVAVHDERPAAAGAGQPADGDRPVAVVVPGRHHRVARELGRVRLPLVDLASQRAQAVADVRLEVGLLVSGVARSGREVDRCGVEPDEVADESNEIVLAGRDVVVGAARYGGLGHRPPILILMSYFVKRARSRRPGGRAGGP